MGSVFSSFLSLFKEKQASLLMVGLDNAGKTTILYRLKLGEVLTTTPTLGFNVETLKYNRLSFTVWDIGGQDKIRPLWKHYYNTCDGIIFVIDSTDKERLNTAIEELDLLLCEPSLEKAVFLILLNKQDLPGAVSASQFSKRIRNLPLHSHKWKIQGSNAITGKGLYEGLDWLSRTVSV